MKFTSAVWQQIKSISAEELKRALQKDGWDEEPKRGAIYPFVKEGRHVAIHFHPGKTYGPRLLKKLLDDIGWSQDDLERLGVIKRRKGTRR